MVTPNPHTQAYLRNLGLDPDSVLQTGMTEAFYLTPVRDSFGYRHEPKAWPEGFSLKLLIAFMKKDGIK